MIVSATISSPCRGPALGRWTILPPHLPCGRIASATAAVISVPSIARADNRLSSWWPIAWSARMP
jgi:hypothetical protein